MESKIYCRIGEVGRRIGVAAHTIRYWEKEFSFFLQPTRNNRGQRLYTESEITKLGRLKDLLYQNGYRITAVKRILHNKNIRRERKDTDFPVQKIIKGLQRLNRILTQIEKI